MSHRLAGATIVVASVAFTTGFTLGEHADLVAGCLEGTPFDEPAVRRRVVAEVQRVDFDTPPLRGHRYRAVHHCDRTHADHVEAAAACLGYVQFHYAAWLASETPAASDRAAGAWMHAQQDLYAHSNAVLFPEVGTAIDACVLGPTCDLAAVPLRVTWFPPPSASPDASGAPTSDPSDWSHSEWALHERFPWGWYAAVAKRGDEGRGWVVAARAAAVSSCRVLVLQGWHQCVASHGETACARRFGLGGDG